MLKNVDPNTIETCGIFTRQKSCLIAMTSLQLYKSHQQSSNFGNSRCIFFSLPILKLNFINILSNRDQLRETRPTLEKILLILRPPVAS